ncbi:MAG: class I SAM-dependent methyltransferase [Bacteroidales bacterium]|nr:class I SAM-dependent methyltransferase [Bacteroidales bacterium]
MKGNLLDVGCGSGALLPCVDPSSIYVGIDLDEQKLSDLRQEFPQYNFLKINVEDGLNLNEHKDTVRFDTITMIALIEHISDPHPLLSDSYNLLKTGGKLVITTPSPFGDKMHKLGAMIGLTSKEAVKQHVRIYSKSNLRDTLISHGFTKFEYRRFLFGLNQLVIVKK